MFSNLTRAMTLAAILCAGACAVPAAAQPSTDESASIIAFPLFDSRDAADTILTVTNTNTSTEYCPDPDERSGDVALHFVYMSASGFVEFDRFEFLTPGDTLSVLASEHNPEIDHGYVFVVAVSPVSFEPIAFDALIGSARMIRSDIDRTWSYRPYGFRAATPRSGPCAYDGTDVDNDGARDFDGFEYEPFPRRLRLDSFLSKNEAFENRIVLLTMSGRDALADVRFTIWNNIEEVFLRNFRFRHFFDGDLAEISIIVRQLGGDREELDFLDIETGWVEIEGTRLIEASGNLVRNRGGGLAIPPMLGVFASSTVGSESASGQALHVDGVLDGLELGAGDDDPQYVLGSLLLQD